MFTFQIQKLSMQGNQLTKVMLTNENQSITKCPEVTQKNIRIQVHVVT